ncbi:hypothetical protein EDC01DRAFT_91688 [Geopyxis carbonaria]|nr:hypothetical protein EDC01DRAFT_91688 [Geopyxis carbonaria]
MIEKISDTTTTTMSPTVPTGYPSLASFLTTSPELAVFRKFTQLKMRNLLYLQTELQDLEERLQACEMVANDTRERQLANQSYIDLKRRDTDEDDERMELVGKIRSVMKEYDETLLLTSQVLSLPSPRHNITTILQSYVTQSSKLIDCGERYLTAAPTDLAALAGESTKTDRMTELIRTTCGHYLREKETSLETGEQIGYYASHRVDLIVSFLRVLLATAFLGGAIALLTFGTDGEGMRVKLGIVVALVIAFGLCLTFTTVASRGEVYGASAAYAAVLVVFIGGTSGISK